MLIFLPSITRGERGEEEEEGEAVSGGDLCGCHHHPPPARTLVPAAGHRFRLAATF